MNIEASDNALSRPYRVFCAVMASVFLLSAAVQWNDPDPGRWIAFYGLGALTEVTQNDFTTAEIGHAKRYDPYLERLRQTLKQLVD